MTSSFYRVRTLGLLAFATAAFLVLGFPPAAQANPGPPTLVSAAMEDANSDGIVDTVVMTFSQTLNDTPAGTNGFAVDGGGSDEHGTCSSVSANPDGTTTLVLTFTCTEKDTAVDDMSVSLTTNSGVTGAFGDVASFTVNAVSTPALTDSAPAQLKSFTYQDTDNDGKIDHAFIYFTETIDGENSTMAPNDLAFSNVGDFTGVDFGSSATDAITTDTTGVSVTFGTEASAVDTHEDSGNLAISTQNAFVIEDKHGNYNSTLGTQPQLDIYDNAAPVLKTATYHGVGGLISDYIFTFSEPVTSASFLSNNDLVITDHGDFTGEAFGGATTDLITSTVSSLDVPLSTQSSGDTHDDSGTLAIATQAAFSLSDGTNVNDNLGAQPQMTYIDGAAPYLTNVTYLDQNGNGKIDAIQLDFTEHLDGASHLSASDLMFSSVGDFAGAAFGSNSTDMITGEGASSVTVPLGTAAGVFDTYDDTETMQVVQNTVTSLDLFDGLNHQTNLNYGLGYYDTTDGAAPVVTAVYPGDGSSNKKKDTIITMTFSEPMETTFESGEGSQFLITPDVGSYLTSFNTDDTVVSIEHADFECDDTVTVTTYESNIYAASNGDQLLTSGPESGDWSYDVSCSSSSSGGGGGSTSLAGDTPTITLTAPTSGTFVAGDSKTVTWTVGGAGISTEMLQLSLDGGTTWSTVATGLTGTSYAWTVPSTSTTNGRLRVSGLDSGSATLASSTSGTITISTGTTPTEPPAETLPPGVTTDQDGRKIAPNSGATGPSPFTGEMQNISNVTAGWYIRGYSTSTVYYVTAAETRRPFWDATTFMTWATSWNDVIWVTDATLATMPLSDVMLPKPAVVLVKVTSDPSVYATQANASGGTDLRHVMTETVASQMYGSAWADYVIDVDPTIMGHYAHGTDITTPETVDTSIMKTRAELAALVNGS